VSFDPLSDEKILDSWHTNAAAWTSAVRDGRIASRVRVTNQAIIAEIVKRSPQSVLDIGCGEGWLVRALDELGIDAIGVDAVSELIERAEREGGGTFAVVSYEEIAAGALNISVDVAVANFSLIGRDSVENLLPRVAAMLAPGGAFIVQTLHPMASCGPHSYEDGWRTGSWDGFSSDFTDPAPWYFRTTESWRRLLEDSGYQTVRVAEPIDPTTQKPLSIIFVAEIA
jgi:2-polyprenyl-3-methyl-5-hydroxy-6-metoxy-1,4-benzoquinol methylase